MKSLILKHWQEGGTVLTNVSQDFDVYAEAVAEYNAYAGKQVFVLHDMPTPNGMAGSKSLHYLGYRRDCSGFWDLVRAIEAEKSVETQLT